MATPVLGSNVQGALRARPQSACPANVGAARRSASAGRGGLVHGGGGRPTSAVGARPGNRTSSSNALAGLLGQVGEGPRLSSKVYGGEYVLGKVLGQGAYASVRQAQHTGTGHKVAIKIFDKQRGNWENRKKQIMREVRLLEQVQHPNVVNFYECIDANLHLYIAVELVDGGSMRQYLNRQAYRRLEETHVRRLFYQVCDGLSYLHERCIAHRDVKLENLLLDRSAEHVKVIDFGFAVQCASREQKLKCFCGTPSYMAPEMVMGREYSGFAVDVWALGVLLFVLLSGRFPFKGQTESELYSKIKRGGFQFPDAVSQIPRRLIRGIMRLDHGSRPTAQQIMQHPWLEAAFNDMSSKSAASQTSSSTNTMPDGRSVCDSQANTVCTPREVPPRPKTAYVLRQSTSTTTTGISSSSSAASGTTSTATPAAQGTLDRELSEAAPRSTGAM